VIQKEKGSYGIGKTFCFHFLQRPENGHIFEHMDINLKKVLL